MNNLSDDQILATADQALVLKRRLQLAHDRMLLCPTGPETEEYALRWREYLDAGGNRSMIENGIDNENWRRHYKKN